MDLKSLLQGENYNLIDVREEMELDVDGSIPEARNIPLAEIEDRKQEIVNLAGPKIFFCKSGQRSQKAVDYFTSQGLTEVYNGGGYEDVKAALEN